MLYEEKMVQLEDVGDRLFLEIMNREKIVKYATEMQTKTDLLKLLNSIKKMELADSGLAATFHPITMKQLNYYCNPKHVLNRYQQFYIPKKSGGRRTINAPQRGSFRFILSALNELFKALYKPSDYAMGFAQGRSIVANAEVHKNQNYVFNIDLKDFFPSIRQPRVWKRIQLPPFNFSLEVANVVAGLCAMKVNKEDGTADYVLPQGAPTSPIITNMVCDKLDRRLAGLAKRFGLRYTRYADDITFSSMHFVYNEDGEFRKELERIITDQGFVINDKKTRLQKRSVRQEVTGVTVNEKLNVTQSYVREIRALLYIWERYGYFDAVSKFLPRYKKTRKSSRQTPDLINVISGKLLYLKMVKGEDDPVYLRLSQKFDILAAKISDPKFTSNSGIKYLETYSISDFEKHFNTKIELNSYTKGVSPKNHAINILTDEQMKGFTKSEQTLLKKLLKSVRSDYFTEDQFERMHCRPPHFYIKNEDGEDIINYITIRRNIKRDIDLHKQTNIAISLCQKGNSRKFWLIHYRAEMKAAEPKQTNIEELNEILDNLLITPDDGTEIS